MGVHPTTHLDMSAKGSKKLIFCVSEAEHCLPEVLRRVSRRVSRRLCRPPERRQNLGKRTVLSSSASGAVRGPSGGPSGLHPGPRKHTKNQKTFRPQVKSYLHCNDLSADSKSGVDTHVSIREFRQAPHAPVRRSGPRKCKPFTCTKFTVL